MRWPWDKPDRRLAEDDLDEWERHHYDLRSAAGIAIVDRARSKALTRGEATEYWRLANKFVGQRAPADYGEFVAYGYMQGRLDALELDGTLP